MVPNASESTSSASTQGLTSKFFSAIDPSQEDQKLQSPVPQPEDMLRGGILLRTLRRTSDNKVFSGPSLLVDELLRLTRSSNIAQLVTTAWGGDTYAFPCSTATTSRPSLRLHAQPSVSQGVARRYAIYRSPRIGLDLSNPSIPVPTSSSDAALKTTLAHSRPTFITRRYRYFTHPHLLTANGRGHTLLGVYETRQSTAEDDATAESVTAEALADVTGLKLGTAAKYLAEYRAGAGDSLVRFLGARGKGAGSSPVSFLRMTGCLDALQGSKLE
jgi:hypothetical protein